MGFTTRMCCCFKAKAKRIFFFMCYIDDDLRNLIMQKDGRCFDDDVGDGGIHSWKRG